MDEHTEPSAPRSGAWCPEFRPTREEFASFAKYIRTQVEPQCAAIGICKIIPPDGWFARSYELADLAACQVARPVSQHVAGKKGVFNVDLVERKTTSVADFAALARSLGHEEPASDVSPDDVERRFWKSLRPTMDAPVYGADIVNSLFGDAEAMSWNLNRLDTILRRIDLPGVTRSMLYFGMWRAMFAFHTEDMDLYSINYVHTGKPKFWYAVPPSAAAQLERAAQSLFPEKHHACNQFMRHKTSMMSPARLKEFGVPYYKAFQNPGEFVITFPATYHQGFNLGFNIAEAVNFASLRWIPFGLKAKVCKCVHDSVSIDMDTFLTKVFDAPEANPDMLGEDAWIFSCRCGKFASSEEPSFVVDEQWFECSECKIWTHVRCVHPEMASLKEEELPPSMLCHRCKPDDKNDPALAPLCSPLANTPVKPVKTTAKSSVLGKRKDKEPLTPTKATPKSTPQSTPKATTPLESVEPEKKPALGHKASARKSLFVKGSTIQFEDAEARVAAVEGKFIRVHYKGQSTHEDEWLPVDSKELQQRILAVSPPPRIRRPSARAKEAALAGSSRSGDAAKPKARRRKTPTSP